MTLQHRPPAIDPPGPDAGRDILLKRLVEGAALAPVEGQHAPSCCTPPSAAEITFCEMPAAAASCEIDATKALKSPPQRAAWDGVARVRAAKADAQKAKAGRKKCMGEPFFKEGEGANWNVLLARKSC